MNHHPRWIVLFACVQLVGLICMWSWPYFNTASAALWGTALVCLFPGNMVSAGLVEKLLWKSTLSLGSMAAIELPFLIGINLGVWFVVIAAFRKVAGRPR